MGEQTSQKIPADVEARLSRNISVILGLIPLRDMVQTEVDWIFQMAIQRADASSHKAS